jgi:uncharacterized peroxidase-related enzyme
MQTPESLSHRNKAVVETGTNLPIVEEADATGAVAEAYGYFREHFGRHQVPGILKCFATHPPLLRQMMGIASTMLFCEGVLTRRMKEAIATYISSLNRCPYCVESHASFLHVHGGSDELVSALSTANVEQAPLDEKERLLLEFVGKVTLDSYKVSADDVSALRLAGWDDLQIAETIHVTALFACFNRVVNAFGLPSQGMFGMQNQFMPQKEAQ